MKPAEISGIGEFSGQEVTLKGWVYNMRSSGKLLFLQMRDGTGIIQCIIEKAVVGDEQFELASGLTQESSLAVTGMVKEDSRAPGGYEMGVSSFEIYQIAEPYPITPKDHGSTFLMDNRHLWLRSRRQNAILKAWSVSSGISSITGDSSSATRLSSRRTPVKGRPLSSRRSTSAIRHTSRRADSSTTKRPRQLSARSTPSARPSGRRSRRRGAT